VEGPETQKRGFGRSKVKTGKKRLSKNLISRDTGEHTQGGQRKSARSTPKNLVRAKQESVSYRKKKKKMVVGGRTASVQNEDHSPVEDQAGKKTSHPGRF